MGCGLKGSLSAHRYRTLQLLICFICGWSSNLWSSNLGSRNHASAKKAINSFENGLSRLLKNSFLRYSCVVLVIRVTTDQNLLFILVRNADLWLVRLCWVSYGFLRLQILLHQLSNESLVFVIINLHFLVLKSTSIVFLLMHRLHISCNCWLDYYRLDYNRLCQLVICLIMGFKFGFQHQLLTLGTLYIKSQTLYLMHAVLA